MQGKWLPTSGHRCTNRVALILVFRFSQGDGGGPLVCLIKNDDQRLNTYVQVGAVSWGINCAQKEMPAVYSDVQSEAQWILAEANVLQIFNGE